MENCSRDRCSVMPARTKGRNIKKRILSLVLVVALLLAVMPTLSLPASAGGISEGSTFVIKEDGSLWAWGNNFGGYLGDGTTDNLLEPVKIIDDVDFASIGGGRVMAIMTDNSLWAWGLQMLGDGFIAGSNSPKKIMDDVVSVSTSNNHTAAITSDGSLWTWGYNNWGQLGDGTTEDRLSPVKVMEDVVFVLARGANTLAIKADGSLWTWGNNYGGNLGDGTTDDSYSPVIIMEDVAFASLGYNHTIAIKTDGSLWAWGDNEYGQLGDGTTETRLSPTFIMNDVASVSVSNVHSSAIKTDGSLWTWGYNIYGMIGDGTDIDRYNPVKVMENVVSVSAYGANTFALTEDGDLWGWGDVSWGQLTGTSIQNTPVLIMESVDSFKIFGYNAAAIKIDGSLWCWGLNDSGELGDGTTTSSSIPIKIMDGAMLFPDPLKRIDITSSSNVTYIITATAGTGGSISPSGSVSVTEGNDQTFAISANSGYEILDVLVDGQSVGAVSSYTFLSVDDDHTISATFRQIDSTADIYTITASAGTGGRISPSGYVSVAEGDNQTFTITANNGYSISNVRVDGVSIGARSSYTFYGVIDNHAISATFTSDSSSSSSGSSSKVTVYSPSGSSGSTIYSSSDSSVGSSGVRFSDTGSHWASYYIENVAEKGWIVGYPDGTFKPNGSITRAELIMIVYRLTGGASSADVYQSGYSDVGSADWYAAAVGYCADRGYLNGVFDGDSFLPKQAITRGEVAAILAKTRGYSGSGSAQSSFSDVNPDDTFAGSIEYLAGKELLNGYPDGTFRQDNSITRAEICTILFKGWIA